MATLQHSPEATGAPGIAPRWTHSAKDVIGTAYSTASRVWFTVSDGVISEVYFPTLDHPQIRDLQFLVSDGETFLHDTHRDLESSMEYLGEHGLGVRIINADPAGRYRLVIEVITDPHQACLLLDGRLEGDSELLRRLHLYVLLAPHIEVAGWGNTSTKDPGRHSRHAANSDMRNLTQSLPSAESPVAGEIGESTGVDLLAAHATRDRETGFHTAGVSRHERPDL